MARHKNHRARSSSITAAASAWSASATVTGKLAGWRDDLTQRKNSYCNLHMLSIPTMSAADFGVRPAVTNEPKALEVPVYISGSEC